MLELNQPFIDLGQVKLGSDAFFEAKIRNHGHTDIRISAQPSCSSCTQVLEQPPIILATGEGLFRFKYHPTSTGTAIRSVFFQEGNEVRQTLMFKSEVID